MFSIWLQSTEHNKEIYDLITRFAKEEVKDPFFPHVTLVTKISTYEKAMNILKLLSNEKCIINFDKISTGETYFQRLYLESSDNTYFFNSVSKIEGWPSLWVPHLSLYYGDELPKSFDLGELNKLIPVALTFDTIAVYKTGSQVSEWKEITTLYLD
jgi:hypothetical protein|tara:strand:+ start:2123 stop:2590 length:468 start_codon:yes stop_codon:yes gene_type:complete